MGFKQDCSLDIMPAPTTGAVSRAFTACCESGGHDPSTCQNLGNDIFSEHPYDAAVQDNTCEELIDLFKAHALWAASKAENVLSLAQRGSRQGVKTVLSMVEDSVHNKPATKSG